MKSCKQQLKDRMNLRYQDKFRTLEENETYKYLRILEADRMK